MEKETVKESEKSKPLESAELRRHCRRPYLRRHKR